MFFLGFFSEIVCGNIEGIIFLCGRDYVMILEV